MDGWAGSRKSHAQETGNPFLLLITLLDSYLMKATTSNTEFPLITHSFFKITKHIYTYDASLIGV